MTYTVKQARDKFTQVLKIVENGEVVTITRNGRAVAEIVPAKRKRNPKFGTLKDRQIVIDPDWDRPQNDIEAWLRGDV
jgi:prevent-host-death family protein